MEGTSYSLGSLVRNVIPMDGQTYVVIYGIIESDSTKHLETLQFFCGDNPNDMFHFIVDAIVVVPFDYKMAVNWGYDHDSCDDWPVMEIWKNKEQIFENT